MFYIIFRLWPSDRSVFAYNESSGFSLRSLHGSFLAVCLNALNNLKVEPSPDVVFNRVITLLLPLSPEEWDVIISKNGIYSMMPKVRSICLEAVTLVSKSDVSWVQSFPHITTILWAMKFDEHESVAISAVKLINATGIKPDGNFFGYLSPLLYHDALHLKNTVSKAIAGSLSELISYEDVNGVMDQLKQIFTENTPLKVVNNKTDNKKVKPSSKLDIIASIPIKTAANVVEDKNFDIRLSIAKVFSAIGIQKPFKADGSNLEISSEIISNLIEFILTYGVVDINIVVRAEMLLAGRYLFDNYGLELRNSLMVLLQEVLNKQISDNEDVSDFDNRHSAAVVLLGSTGKYLDKENPEIIVIMDTLIKALHIPSETVQRSIADCLSPLIVIVKGNPVCTEKLEQLTQLAQNGPSYGDRRGAAYGVSAFVKGLGISVLKTLDIISKLKESCINGSINSRQGSLFILECLSERLGLLFEPYIITIMPTLLKSFSHSSDHVRDAAHGAAKVIMAKLSAHGVKQVLTPILDSLPEETAWKSRQEAIRLLGMMAHCAPKQLSLCLPQIVPRLVDAGSDPHPKVKESAKEAMSDISSVIRNPEIAQLGPILLAALGDPAHKTKDALEALLECEFMHSIDAPSLALLIPILGRALKDRGADLKRKSAAITGNIMSMVSDQKSLSPYLCQVIPGLKSCLLDPIPDVRATRYIL